MECSVQNDIDFDCDFYFSAKFSFAVETGNELNWPDNKITGRAAVIAGSSFNDLALITTTNQRHMGWMLCLRIFIL